MGSAGEPTRNQRLRDVRLERAQEAVFKKAGRTHEHPARAELLERYRQIDIGYAAARRDSAPAAEIARHRRERDAALLAAKESGILMRDLERAVGISADTLRNILRRARVA